MDWKAIVRERLDVQTGDPALDTEIVDELAEHLAERFQDARTAGVDDDVALRQVLSEFHDSRALASALQANRAHRRVPPPAAPAVGATPRPLAGLGRDIRYACRLLARTPSFTAAAILLLALGIGGATAIFSVVDAVLVQPLPYVAAERLVAVWETDRTSGTIREPASVPDFLDLQARATHVEAMGGVIAADVTLTPPRGQATRLAGMLVTQDLLPMLGTRPLAGRTFASDEHRTAGGDRIVISARLARRLFGDPAAAVGQTLSLDDGVRTIVGVMPDTADVGMIQWLLAADYSRGFADRDVRSRVDVWLPLALDPARRPRQTHPLLVVARTRPGVPLPVAQTEIGAIMAALERDHPVNEGRGAHLEAFTDVVLGPVRPALLALLLAVGLVLLSVCVNVANLLLVRGTGRLREVAIRTALGASPVRLTRQFIVENAVLASAALALGLLFACASVHALVALAPPTVPRLADVGLDGRVLLAALGIGVAVAMAFGLVPVMQSRRLDVQRLLAIDGRGSSAGRARGRMRAWLVGAEVALAVVLTVGAGLMVRTLWQVSRVDPGFRTTGVVKAEFQLPERRYPKDFRNWPRFVEVHRFNAALIEDVGRLPGVEAAAIAANHPLDSGFGNSFVVVGREAEARDWPEISVRAVSPGYFHTLGVPVLQGRALEARDDTESAPVLLLNEAAAQRFFDGRDPLGQEIAFWGVARRIVGVVGSERIRGVTEAAPPAVYVPIAQNPTRGPEVLMVRGSNVGALTTSVRQAIARVDPELAVFGLEPLADTLRETQGHRRFVAQLLLAFAGLALLLATIGVHAVLSYDVAQRRREIGIRLALGAKPSGVSRTIVGRAMLLVVAGLAVGAVASIGLTRLIRGLLFEVAPGDGATLALVVAVFGVAALVASYVPARRAARTDPMTALRHE